jgi:hypothetical protein
LDINCRLDITVVATLNLLLVSAGIISCLGAALASSTIIPNNFKNFQTEAANNQLKCTFSGAISSIKLIKSDSVIECSLRINFVAHLGCR